MQEKVTSHWRKLSDKFTQLFQHLSEWRGGIGVVIFILAFALVTRAADLSSFPYFPSNWPWNGVNGIYADEYTTSLMIPLSSATYFPFVQIALMRLAISILGYGTFSIRIVSASFSSVTAVLVYLSANELFHKKLPAFISSLYFIMMTPALIFGRMAFIENGATTFFVATFFCCMKYFNTSNDRWLLCSVVFAGFSFLCKQTGIVATVFLILFIYIYRPEAMRKLLKWLLITGSLGLIYFVQIMIFRPSYLGSILNIYVAMSIRSVDWFNVLLTTAMPTGHILIWHHFPEMLSFFWLIRCDFWYILAYFIIVFLAFKEREIARKVLLAITPYILLLILIGHTNVYYVILIQPFLAIPVGYGLSKLQTMSGEFAFAFSLLLLFPAVTYINYYVSYFLINTVNGALLVIHLVTVSPLLILCAARFVFEKYKRLEPMITIRLLLIYFIVWSVIGDYVLTVFSSDTVWTIIQFTLVVPVVGIGMIRLWYPRMGQKEAITVNRILLISFMMCLIVGSYFLPVFYPGYFAQSTVPT